MWIFGGWFTPQTPNPRDVWKSSDGVEWVFVMSWNRFHREQVCAAFEAGKHVFCEKPIATSPEDCRAVKAAYEKSGRKCVVGFTMRYSPHYRKIKDLIEAGTVGEIISLEFNETLAFNHGGHIHSGWRRHAANSGGHVLEKCCHDIDMAYDLVRSPVARVASFGGKNFFMPINARHIERLGSNTQGEDAYRSWPQYNSDNRVNPFCGDSDVVDNQVAIIEYENGVRATFHTNCNAGIPERRMYILGTEGAIRADVVSGHMEVGRIGFDESVQNESLGYLGDHAGGDEVLGPQLYACMVDDAPPRSTLENGYASAMTALAIEEARRTGTVVDARDFIG